MNLSIYTGFNIKFIYNISTNLDLLKYKTHISYPVYIFQKSIIKLYSYKVVVG